jgi:hypothetical protein
VERRFTTIQQDGWALQSAEARHRESPATFEIPAAESRAALRRGDAAKLLFDIETREGGIVVDRGVDRMWVIVTEVDGPLYVGVLDSDPGMADGLELRPGSEVLFRAEHVCGIDRPPDDYLVARFGPSFLDPR